MLSQRRQNILGMKKIVNPKLHWADQWKLLPSQSDFHNALRDIFCTDTYFSGIKCFQEVPVIDLCTDYFSKQHRFDWYIEAHNAVIELHGEQHYKPTSFTSGSYDQKLRDYKDMQRRDSAKKEAALESGFKYIAIPYSFRKEMNGLFIKTLLLGT